MIIQKTHNLTEYNSIFEIPIYRLSNNDFINELKFEVLKSAENNSVKIMQELFPEKGKKLYENLLSTIKIEKEYQWKFNEIIGWITLHFSDSFIFAEVFLKNSKRITKNNKAKIDYYGVGFKFKISENSSNKNIYENLLKNIEFLANDSKFKKRFVDISKFEAIGPFVNWKALNKFLND